jgi:hypothetical protein
MVRWLVILLVAGTLAVLVGTHEPTAVSQPASAPKPAAKPDPAKYYVISVLTAAGDIYSANVVLMESESECRKLAAVTDGQPSGPDGRSAATCQVEDYFRPALGCDVTETRHRGELVSFRRYQCYR